tara:strand:- start:392 stop:562 length:171 start_codon:yes stop_codon:yes gene_type:complete
MSQPNIMHILLILAGLILWYIAYDAKPIINDGMKNILEEENLVKRNKLLNILKQSF